MAGRTPTDAIATQPGAMTSSWQVRIATDVDIPDVAAAVNNLLAELGGASDGPSTLEPVVRELLRAPDAGALLVAREGDALVGVIAASWQLAIHVPGRYALVQDLWVHPSGRGRGIGRELIRALADVARELRMLRIEVGLPSERFAAHSATESFYRDNGFSHLGPRMRLELR